MTSAERHSSRLRVGLDLIPAERSMDGRTPGWSDLLEMAQIAEKIGIDSIWVPDHFIFPVSPDETCGTWECWSLIAALAVGTERVEIGSLVLGSGYRNPTLLAKMADTVNEISNGRLILGIGSGWLEPEYRAFGYPYDNRVNRFEEAVQILRGLLDEGAVDFSGQFYEAQACELRPRNANLRTPPIMIGSRSPRMHGIAARYADWWNGSWTTSSSQFRPRMDAVDEACNSVGRDPTTLTRTAGVIVFLPVDSELTTMNPFWTAIKAMGGAEPLTGTPEQIADELHSYHELGVEHVQIILNPMTVSGIEQFERVLDILRA